MKVSCSRYPDTRLRRLRRSPWIRDLVSNVTLDTGHLIQPLFVRPERIDADIPGFAGIRRYSLAELPDYILKIREAGIRTVALFPYTATELRTSYGEEAINPANLICEAIRCVKAVCGDMGVMTDVALDPYTDHGHDGILSDDGLVANDTTIAMLVQQAVIQAKAGADIIAPSDMMDGRVGAIRQALDCNGFEHVCILSYSAKYCSAFYRPFRDAVGTPAVSDKKNYQMDFARTPEEAYHEALQDVEEGADMIMVKPGLAYLDVLAYLSGRLLVPSFAFQVSGEYMMLHRLAGGDKEYLHGLLHETLIGFRRAGACGIVSYGAYDWARGRL